jgi:hypothetical protein
VHVHTTTAPAPPVSQGRKLRDYFHETRDLLKARARKDVFVNLSPVLRERTSWNINKRWIVTMQFFSSAEKSFLALARHESAQPHGLLFSHARHWVHIRERVPLMTRLAVDTYMFASRHVCAVRERSWRMCLSPRCMLLATGPKRPPYI